MSNKDNKIFTYTYRIPQYNIVQITDEVYSSLNKLLVASYEGEPIDGSANSQDDIITFNFFIDLTAEEKATLDDLMFNYIFDSKYDDSKKFKINNSLANPFQIDYDILGFKKKRNIVKGELREVGYFNNFDSDTQTYSDLVVLETRDYTRDPIGIVQYRTQTSTWFLKDGSIGNRLSYTKYYTDEEAIQEGIDRRTNMIAFGKTTLLRELKAVYGEPTNQSYAFDLLISVKLQMDYYTQGYTQPLKDAITGSTKFYMGVCQQESITATTIVNSGASQTDTVTINGIDFSYTSSTTPTISEIANGLINLITGTTATSVSNYVKVIFTDIPNGTFDLKSKIPGWPFTLSITENLTTSNVKKNDNTLKTNVLEQITF